MQPQVVVVPLPPAVCEGPGHGQGAASLLLSTWLDAWGSFTVLWNITFVPSVDTCFQRQNMVSHCPGDSQRAHAARQCRPRSPKTSVAMGSTVTTPWTWRAGPPNQRDTVPRGAAPRQAHEMLGVAILVPEPLKGPRVSPSSFPARCTRPAGAHGF